MTAATSKTLRYALIAGALMAVVLILPFVTPVGVYRNRIENAVQHATGRVLHIEGPFRLMLFPQFGVKAEKVTFANMPGGRAGAMARAGDIKLAVRFLPLLIGRIEIAEIVMDRPIVELEVDAQGRANWQFAKPKGAPTGAGRKTTATLPTDTSFSGIRIKDGRISYTNVKTGTHRVIDNVDAYLAVTRLDKPGAVDGNFKLGERRVDFLARIATLKSLLGGGATAFDLSLTSDLMQASFKGVLAGDGEADGALKFMTADLRGLADAVGEKLPVGGGLSDLSLESRIATKDKITRLSDLRLSLDRQTMTGNLTIDARAEIPSLTGDLAVDRLDLNPYFQTEAKRPWPAKRRKHHAKGWSKAPINLALLREADAELSLKVGALRLRGLRLGKTVARLTLAGGALTARLDPIALYGGTGRAEFSADVNEVPRFRGTLEFEGVELRPLLDDMLGIDRIAGAGSLTLDASAQGASADAVMRSLAGNGAIAAEHGRIRGVDLGLVARTIRMVLGGGATGEVAGTDFSEMGGSFVIASGVLSNKDFRLTGEALKMTGAGKLDIGNRTIDFRLTPKAAAKGASFGIPFRVRGSWDHVHYAPDLGGLVNEVLHNLESGRAPFKGLFGGGKKKKTPSTH